MGNVSIVASVLSFAILLAPAKAPAQALNLTIEQVMTPTQLRDTGVATLTTAQKASLNRWLNEYTTFVLRMAAPGVAPGANVYRPGTGLGASLYPGLGSGHWIKKVSSGGRTVELEDGSLWEVSAVDRIYTALWLPVTDITVTNAKVPVGEFRYVLINKDDGETALAKYIGK